MINQSVGIDISKATFDAAIYNGMGYIVAEFTNDIKGFHDLTRWLKTHCDNTTIHACLEATGRYGDALAHYLHQQQIPVSVVNPARIKAYRNSQLRRNKTDREDARAIAHFCATQTPRLWTPPPPHIQQLQALTRRLNALKQSRTAEKNRLKSGEMPDIVRDSLVDHIAHLDKEIDALHAHIHQMIDQHPDLKEQKELLLTIPGIGDITAAEFISEVPDVHQFDSASQLAAFAGLTPSHRQSGTSLRTKGRMSKMGNKRLRNMFYMPATSAKRYNPIVKRLADRLTERGKSPRTIRGAVMRQLLHIAYGVLKHRRPFDPNYSNLQSAS